MSLQSVRMVVFDLGGVLVRICRSWPEACERAGVPVREGWDDPAAREQRRALSGLYHEGGIETNTFCARLAATAGGLYTAAEVRRVHDAWLIAEYEGVGALIDDLHAAGVPTGVLSNTNEAHWHRLAPRANVAPEFPTLARIGHLHASHLLRLAKPSVECYRAFEDRAGLVNAGGGVVFFDDLEENIAGAAGAGWRGVRVDHMGDTAQQMRSALIQLGVGGMHRFSRG